MSLVTKFDDFLNEEKLPPSKFRKYMKTAAEVDYKERYKEIFEEMKKKYDGDRNAMRIFIPLKKEIRRSEVQHEVEQFLKTQGIREKDIDYIGGTFRFPYTEGDRLPNPQRIGRFLSRKNRNDLLTQFDSDPVRSLRGEKDDLMVCISRHPYDLAGADTDRRWVNCMTLFHYNRFQDAWLCKGGSIRFLMGDVKKGSVVAFLIKKDDRNIQDPISNLAIKPYVNIEDKEDIVLVPDNRMYGLADEDFKRTVFAWSDEFNGNKIGYYKLSQSIYQDNFIRIGQKDEFGEKYDDPIRYYSTRHLPKDFELPKERKKRVPWWAKDNEGIGDEPKKPAVKKKSVVKKPVVKKKPAVKKVKKVKEE